MFALKAVFSGDVQGVGLRGYCKRTASSFKVSGWVKNDPQGTVIIFAQGDESEVEDFLKAVRNGRYVNNISDMQTNIAESRNINSFVIKY